MNFSNTLFRASANGYLMTESRSKSEGLSETTKTHLIDVYVQSKYGRQTDISNKYVSKGLMVEEDSITLYSLVKKNFFRKNEQHLSNEFIKGTPDLFTGLEITNAETVIDIKSSWDIYTFFRVHTQPLNKMYYWQLQSYMALTGAKKSKLVYCLVNTPETIILDEERKLFYKMNAGTTENPDYIKATEELRKAMQFDDIPMDERVIEIDVERNDDDITRLYERVKQCRVYLNGLEEKLNPSAILATYQPNDKVTIIEDIKSIPLIKI
jgi:hypothetical protein